MSQVEPEKYLFSVEQAAIYLGIEPRTVRYHFTKGGDEEKRLHPVMEDSPHWLDKRTIVFTKTELERFKALDLKPGKQGDWKPRNTK